MKLVLSKSKIDTRAGGKRAIADFRENCKNMLGSRLGGSSEGDGYSV